MTDDFTPLEQRLVEGYRAQTPLYARALILATRTEDASSLHDLNAILRDIAVLNAALADDRAAWQSARRRPGPQLREVLDGIAERIRTLAAIVDRRVVEVQERKQALLPEVDECIQQRRMLHAYGKSQ